MRLKSILKYTFYVGTGFFALLVLAVIFFILFFPVNTVREMAVDELTSLLQRPVSIADAEIRLFSGVQLSQIRIADAPHFHQITEPDSSALLSIQTAILKYQFWPLLRRQVVIDEIIFDTPHVFLRQDSRAIWNFDSLLIALSDSTPPMPDTAVAQIPVSVQLEKFEIRNLKFSMVQNDDSSTLALSLESLTGQIFDLHIPRALPDEILEKLRARIHLEMSASDLNLCYLAPFDSLNLNFYSKIDLGLDVAISGLARTELSGKLALFETLLTEPAPNPSVLLDSPKPIPELLRLEILAQADLLHKNFQVPRLNFYLIKELVLQGRGEFREISTQPYIDFQIEQSTISLSAVKSFLAQLSLKDTRSLLHEADWGGRLSLAGCRVTGNPLAETAADGLHFQSVVQVRNAYFKYLPNVAQVEDLDAQFFFSGIYSAVGFDALQTRCDLQIPAWQTAPNDSLQLEGRDFALKFKADLSRKFFPESAEAELSVATLQDAAVSLNLALHSDGTWKNSEMSGALDLQNVLLQNFGLTDLVGRASARLSLQATSLDSIQLNLAGELDSLYFLYEDWEPLGRHQIAGDFWVKTDSLFQDLFVNRISLRVSDFLKLSGRAELRQLGADGFALLVDAAQIDHRKIISRLPAVFTEEIGNFDISGETIVSAQITGALPDDAGPVFRGQAHLETRKTHLDLPDYYFLFRNIQIKSDVLLFSDSLAATVQASIDSFYLTDLRREPFRNSTIQAELELPHLARIKIPACTVILPEIGAKAWITGAIDSLATVPVTRLDTHLQLAPKSPVVIIDDILLNGAVSATNRLNFQGDLLAINGEIQFDSLNLEVVETLTATGITGKMSVNQKIDLYRLCLVQEELPLFDTQHFADLAYHYLRPFYRHQALPVQSVHIPKIKILDYELNNIFLDVLFGGAKLQIPDFILSAYEGNIHGHLSIDFGEGTFEFPDSLLETTRFDLKATISSINTARLNPVISAKTKKSIINANVELTGAGLSPEGDLLVNGYFHITEIGSKVADNLLRSLDPTEADQGIQSVRNLLKFGYQPRLMSFEIKHGHFYPRIELSKPFYIPINIAGGVVELARIPTEIFLKQAVASPYYTE